MPFVAEVIKISLFFRPPNVQLVISGYSAANCKLKSIFNGDGDLPTYTRMVKTTKELLNGIKMNADGHYEKIQ